MSGRVDWNMLLLVGDLVLGYSHLLMNGWAQER